MKCNRSIPEDESMHPPTEEPTTEEAPDVAKWDFPLEPESVEGHTSTPADNINEPDVVDIFSTPRQHATTSQAIIVSPTRASIDSLVWRLK